MFGLIRLLFSIDKVYTVAILNVILGLQRKKIILNLCHKTKKNKSLFD